MTTLPPPVRYKVRHMADKLSLARAAGQMAGELGFDPNAREEISIVVAELASNLIRHAGSGEIILEPMLSDGRQGIRVISQDRGPGIKTPQIALGDGNSEDRGLGYGLGTINRLMDDLEIVPPTDDQPVSLIICRKWLEQKNEPVGECPLGFGVAARPIPGSKVNGDSYVIKTWGHQALVGAIDGLGHGQFAHRASQKARNYLQTHYDQPFTNLFLGVGRECLTTRGVVMALARFDWQHETVEFSSIGNISTRVFGAPQGMRFNVRRGVLGHHSPNPHIEKHPWEPSYTMVMHSDGLHTIWGVNDVPGLLSMPAQIAAKKLMDALSKQNDDAVVLVVKGKTGGDRSSG